MMLLLTAFHILCVYVYVCTQYVRMYVCMYACMYLRMYVCLCIGMYASVDKQPMALAIALLIPISTPRPIPISISFLYLYLYVCIRAHTHTHIDITITLHAGSYCGTVLESSALRLCGRVAWCWRHESYVRS